VFLGSGRMVGAECLFVFEWVVKWVVVVFWLLAKPVGLLLLFFLSPLVPHLDSLPIALYSLFSFI
jgi:hypothetical protein